MARTRRGVTQYDACIACVHMTRAHGTLQLSHPTRRDARPFRLRTHLHSHCQARSPARVDLRFLRGDEGVPDPQVTTLRAYERPYSQRCTFTRNTSALAP